MKVLHVIRREYLENVRKKAFIVSTILAPIILIGFYSLPILSVYFVSGEPVSLAVLDRTGQLANRFVPSLDDTLKDGRSKFVVSVYDDPNLDFDAEKDALIAAINRDELDVLIEMPEDVLESSRVNYISKDQFNEVTMDRLREQLNPVIVGQRLAGEGLDFERVSKLTSRVRFNENKITKSGVLQEQEVLGELIMVIIFVLILYMTLLSWGLSVQRAIIEEKSSRVIEVMLSSVEPRDLFFGKIFGIGALGLTQMAVWSIVLGGLGLSSAAVLAQYSDFIQVSISDVFYFLTFYVLGFLFYSALFTIIGAVCSTEQDAQQLQTLVILPLVIPLMSMFLVIQNPSATISVVLSYVPFFTPMLMLTRIVVSEPPTWEILLSIVILLVSIYLVTIFSSRVFRVGILLYGKRPSLREIIRWSRYA